MHTVRTVHSVHTKGYRLHIASVIMVKAYSLKARQHYGSKSLDLTIPHSICNEFGISDGDVFILDVSEERLDGSVNLILKYKRVFSQISARTE
jgi:hypothetical protein